MHNSIHGCHARLLASKSKGFGQEQTLYRAFSLSFVGAHQLRVSGRRRLPIDKRNGRGVEGTYESGPQGMAVASGRAGRVLARPLFRRLNVHVRTLNASEVIHIRTSKVGKRLPIIVQISHKGITLR